MDINIVYLLCLIFSASYIGTVSINEILLLNNVYMCLFTHYNRYRNIFLGMQYLAYGILLYLIYLFYQQYGISLTLLLVILMGYNISGLLRSFFREWLFLMFYVYPFFIGFFIYQYFFPVSFNILIPKGVFLATFIIIFFIQSILDEKYLKRQIDQYIIISQLHRDVDFLREENQRELVESIKSRNPYYSESQIVSALRKVLVSNS